MFVVGGTELGPVARKVRRLDRIKRRWASEVDDPSGGAINETRRPSAKGDLLWFRHDTHRTSLDWALICKPFDEGSAERTAPDRRDCGARDRGRSATWVHPVNAASM